MIGRAAGRWHSGKTAVLLALALPCLAGIGYLLALGAPALYVAVNGGALVAGLILIGLVPPLRDPVVRRGVAIALLVVLALPFALGPQVDGVARWLAIGGFALHTGMLVIPLLCALAALDRQMGPWLLLAAIVLALAQPDMASCLALTFAAARLWLAEFDWRMAVLAVLGAGASLYASFVGAVEPQLFVEGVLSHAWQFSPLASLALFAALVASFVAILSLRGSARVVRTAIAGALVGFTLGAIWGPYPYPLIGYGASPILGFALALSFGRAAEQQKLGDWNEVEGL